MGKKKVEIIDVSLNIDIAEEIRSKVDSLNNEIIEHTKTVVRKSGMKIQRTNKKQLARQAKLEKTKLAVKFLEAAFEVPERWVESKEVLEAVGDKVTPQNMNKLSMQIRKYFEKEDKWTLSKKRRSGKTIYRLVKFS